MGPITDEIRTNMGKGWGYKLERIGQIALRLKTERRK
jgi:hypothetical protein